MIALLIIAVFVIILLASSISIVRQSSTYITEFLGKYHRTLSPGLHILVPFLEKVSHKINLKTMVLDSEPQPVFTKDNVGMSVSTVTYYKITDPFKSVYEIQDVEFAILNICSTTLRDVIGGLDLDETYTSRETINKKLRVELDNVTNNWGVRVERVEVKDINPPKDIREAMEKQMRAERTKRAQILEAQGLQESQILNAEGQKQAQILTAQAAKDAQILEAEAHKQAQILNAEGEQAAILLLAESEKKASILRSEAEQENVRLLGIAEADRLSVLYKALKDSDIDENIISLESIKALTEVAKGNNNMLVPYESSALMGSLKSLNLTNLTEKK